MTLFLRRALMLGALCAGCCASYARADFFEDFNTAGVIAGGTAGTNFNASATLPYVEADGVGVGGTRGLSVTGTADSGATYKVSSLDFSTTGAALQVSAFFKTVGTIGLTGEDRIFECNLVIDNTNIVTGAHTGVGGKLEFVPNTDGFDDLGIEFRRSNADVNGGATQTLTGFDIKPNTWYKVTYTATNNGPGAVIPSNVFIDEYNANGTTLVTANVFTHSFDIPNTLNGTTNPDMSLDSTVWAAFRVRNGTRLIAAIDNFQAGVFTTFHAGDVDKDGDVDLIDYGLIRDHFRQSVTLREHGDLNNDGVVNFRDFRQWKDNYPFTPVVPTADVVPEPATGAMGFWAVAAVTSLVRSRRRRLS